MWVSYRRNLRKTSLLLAQYYGLRELITMFVKQNRTSILVKNSDWSFMIVAAQAAIKNKGSIG